MRESDLTLKGRKCRGLLPDVTLAILRATGYLAAFLPFRPHVLQNVSLQTSQRHTMRHRKLRLCAAEVGPGTAPAVATGPPVQGPAVSQRLLKGRTVVLEVLVSIRARVEGLTAQVEPQQGQSSTTAAGRRTIIIEISACFLPFFGYTAHMHLIHSKVACLAERPSSGVLPLQDVNGDLCTPSLR